MGYLRLALYRIEGSVPLEGLYRMRVAIAGSVVTTVWFSAPQGMSGLATSYFTSSSPSMQHDAMRNVGGVSENVYM